MPANETDIKKKLYTDGGLEIEGYGPGGITTIVKKQSVQVVRDMGEYATPTVLIIIAHIIYAYTGNVMLLFFFALVQVITSHWFTEGEEYQDRENLSRENEKLFMADKRFHVTLWISFAFESLTWIWALVLFSDDVKFDSFYLNQVKPKTKLQYFAFTMVFGFLSSINSAVGHELVHKREWYNKYLGMFCYSKYFYSHFMVEHCEGHHKEMGTPKDPATALKNETLYAFLCREVYQSHTSTWNREKKKTQRQHGKDAPFLIILINNKMTYYFVLHVLMAATIYGVLGWGSLKHQFVYASWGIFYFEFLNYIEHYGLMRNKDKNGVYESINKLHSWNAVSSPLLFKIQRHSDHHIASFRPYQVLRRMDDAPWHPWQYMSCLWIAIVPPFWFWCVNPRVDAIRDLQNGIKGNLRCWNNSVTPLTEHDKKIKLVSWAYLCVLLVFFGYFSFLSTTFNVFHQ